jgi:hypothetical protein
LKIITINVPEIDLLFFEKVLELGLYPSRSEAMRRCIEIGKVEIMREYEKAISIINTKIPEPEPSPNGFNEKLTISQIKLLLKNAGYSVRYCPKHPPLGNRLYGAIEEEVIQVPLNPQYKDREAL